MRPPRPVLILGGTAEAWQLASALAGEPTLAPTLSLAGRTRDPRPSPIPMRIGGFGGVEGLRGFLRSSGIERVVDATHPFAAQMARHAAQACAAEGVPLLKLTRPPWTAGPGDRWTAVPDLPAAVEALGDVPRRVFLTVGRGSLAYFTAAAWHFYLVRAIETPDLALPNQKLVLQRGPFSVEDESDLLRREGIDVVVTKNSGGRDVEAKLGAARELHLPIIMVERPALPPGVAVVHHWKLARDFALADH